MSPTTKSILEDPLNHPIPETKEEKVKILVNLAKEIFGGYSYISPNQELNKESLDPILDYVLRFEPPYIILVAHLLYKRFDVAFSGNQKWINWFFGRTSEGTQKTDAEVCDIYKNNKAAAKQLSIEFGLGIKSLENF